MICGECGVLTEVLMTVDDIEHTSPLTQSIVLIRCLGIVGRIITRQHNLYCNNNNNKKCFFFIFFFFKQKTAYEILTCDWSSDVCSSDLRVTVTATTETTITYLVYHARFVLIEDAGCDIDNWIAVLSAISGVSIDRKSVV